MGAIPESSHTDSNWNDLHATSHDDATHVLATPENAAIGVLRRAEFVNEAYNGSPNQYVSPLNVNTSTGIYTRVWSNDHAVIYKPIQKDTTQSTLPVYVAIRGTNSSYDLLKDVNIFLDYSSNQYLEILLSSLYTEAQSIAQAIQLHTNDGSPWEMTSHSLGSKYALLIWNHMYAYNHTYASTLAQLAKSTCFNPYTLHSKDYKRLQDADLPNRQKWQYEITSGDFASIIIKNNPPVGATVNYYDPVDVTHQTNSAEYSTFTTLTHYLTHWGGSMDASRAYWLTIAPHTMDSFTHLRPQLIEDSLHLSLTQAVGKHIQTLSNVNLGAFSLAHQPLYLTDNLSIDMPTSNWLNLNNAQQATKYLASIQVVDPTNYDIVLTDPLQVNWSVISLTYYDQTEQVVSSDYFKYVTHGMDATRNEEKLTLYTADGLSVYRPKLQVATLPALLEIVPLDTYSSDYDAGNGDSYMFTSDFEMNDTWHSNRRTEKPGMLNKTICFTYNSTDNGQGWDAYDIDFALYDTGGGFLKWGHIDVGDYNNYKLQLPHKTGDEYYVHSNSYDAATAMYTPSFELVKYDTNRYTIRNTDVLNNGKHLKRPIPDNSLLTSTTSWMMHQNSSGYFIDMEWDAWDGLTGSPDDYLFHIKPFGTPIPRQLGSSLANYDAAGNLADNHMFYPQYMKSPDGQYILTFQRDGNLALFSSAGAVIYTSGTFYAGNGLTLQVDGNVVIYDGGIQDSNVGGPVRWVTGTGGSMNPNGYKIILSVTNTGKIVITDDQDNDLWST